MKIEINNDESYEIKIPEMVKVDEFLGLMGRLSRIGKVLMKDVVSEDLIKDEARGKTRQNPRINRGRINNNWKAYKIDRDLCIRVVKGYYLDPKGDFMKEFNKKYGFVGNGYNNLSKRIDIFKKWHKIKPEEAGLKNFPFPGKWGNIERLGLRLDKEANEKEVKKHAVIEEEEKEETV